MIAIEQMAQREVLCCMSSLVSTLAQGGDIGHARTDIELLCDQACELAAPVLDYEEAATQAGWVAHPEFGPDNGITRKGAERHTHHAESWEQACDLDGIDPYEWEVYEHWAVSQWLAERLIAHGERVDMDFGGLAVWARTCTGQAISMDGCIQRIYAELTECKSLSREVTAQ